MTLERPVLDPLYGVGEDDKAARRRFRDAMQRAAERKTSGRVFVSDEDVHALLFELSSEGLVIDSVSAQAPETRLYVSPEDIEDALKHLRGPVDRDESIVMAAAQAAADALRGSRITFRRSREQR